jgi:uncharacterized protein
MTEYQYNALQTNGLLVDDDHIEMFKKYDVLVGVSIDGPHELNDLRKVRGQEGNDEKTLDSTKAIMANIQKMAGQGIAMSIIITLHRLNATPERLERLMQFIQWLGEIGVTQGNIHTLEVDKTMPDQEEHVLSQAENAEAMITLAKFFEENKHLSYHPFEDIRSALQGNDEDSICIWNNCDSMNTGAVYGIESDLSISNCGRVNKEGINWHKSESEGYERYISLYNTPDELGGCKGCPYFLFCGGGCPGEGMGGDVRNKTMYCESNRSVFKYYEEQIELAGEIPFTKQTDRIEMESILMSAFSQGQSLKIHEIREYMEAQPVFEEESPFFSIPIIKSEE